MCVLSLALALTVHVDSIYDYNEIHPAIACEGEKYTYGAYYNSYERISLYVSRTFKYERVGLELGVLTGYDEVAPIVPLSRVTYDLTDNLKAFASIGVEIDYDYQIQPMLIIGKEIRF